MAFKTSCPSCQRPLRVPDQLIGEPVRCPGCGITWTPEVPDSERPAPPEPAPSLPAPPQDQERPDDAFRETPQTEVPRPAPEEHVRESATEPTPAPPPPPPPPDDRDYDGD